MNDKHTQWRDQKEKSMGYPRAPTFFVHMHDFLGV